MVKQNLLPNILIIAFILVQVCNTKPTSDNATPSWQFVKFTLNGFQQLSINYVTKAKKLNEHLLKDSEIVNSKSAKVVQFKNDLIKFEEKYALLAKDSAVLFELVDLYKNTISHYYKTNETLLDPEENLIFNRLQKYGSNEMNADALKLFNEFVDAFCEKFDTLQQKFKNNDEKLGKSILDWSRHSYAVLKAKDKSSYDEKSEAFEKFFQIIKNEK